MKPVRNNRRFVYSGALVALGIIFIASAAAHGENVADVVTQAPQPSAVMSDAPTEAPQDQPPVTVSDDEFDFSEEELNLTAVRIADPLEPLNRVIFQFNDKLYFWILKPAAQGYNVVFREDIRQSIANFFSNLLTPVRLTNCILQGKFKAAGTETARFFINTTMGVLGFGDAGKVMFNLEISDEDLGQTLGVYGIGNGFFIMWPIVGPSTLRDSAGFGGDLFVNPLTYLEPFGLSAAVGGYRRFNDLSMRLGEYEAIKEAAIEPYSAVRNGYIQLRKRAHRQIES
ncbi:MAG: VacJ family lipoprotein [Deltaproteobacteria bacterium]|nr:VacJ family lipoprotein [Deltaproteobacteria bacterium]